MAAKESATREETIVATTTLEQALSSLLTASRPASDESPGRAPTALPLRMRPAYPMTIL